MRRVMVRYKLRPDRVDENRALVAKIYEELHSASPDGLRYATFQADDQVNFVHLASIETSDGANPLTAVKAFQTFGAAIKERCDEPPQATELTAVGLYRFFGGQSEHVHEDEWGSIIDRPGAGTTEIRWFDTTSDMTGEAFQAFLLRFAAILEARPGRGVLVDATSFRMDRRYMSSEWRDAHIIPRYNAAGVHKFAFQMPAGAPMVGREPAREGPAEFPTGYFATRRDALAWLGQRQAT